MTEGGPSLKYRLDAGCTVLAFLLPLAVYLWTMAPTVYGLDSAELTTAARVLGIAHSPGAPTYMLIGHLISRLPVGDIGYRLNLLSAVFSAATVMTVYRIARELGASIAASLVAAGLLAFSFYFWAWALVAELYAPHAFFSSVVLFCLVRWRNTGQNRLLPCAAFLFGVGCGNHTALVLLAPGYAYLVVSHDRHLLRDPALMAATILSALAGLSVFAYLPIRQAAGPELDYVSRYFPEVQLDTAPGFLWMLRGGMFNSLFFSQRLGALPQEGLHLLHQLLSNFTPLGVGVAVTGCATAFFRRDRAAGLGLGLLFVAHSAFFLTYGAPDRFWMLSVSYVVVSLWAALGIDSAGRLFERARSEQPGRLISGATAASVLLLISVNLPRLNLRHDTSARDYGLLLGSRMERGAVFIGLWEQIPILEYLQMVEGWRTDIQLHNAVFLDPDSICNIVERGRKERRTVYTARPELVPCPGASGRTVLSNALYQVTFGKGDQESWPE